jgi:hypothetical protein
MKSLDVFAMPGVKVDPQKHSGQAIAAFKDTQCAQRALNAMGVKDIDGRPYRVAFEGQTPLEPARPSCSPEAATCIIEIDNLIADINGEDIYARFKRYGPIKAVTKPTTDRTRGSTVSTTSGHTDQCPLVYLTPGAWH